MQRELLAGHVIVTYSARNKVQSEGQEMVIITVSLSEVRRLSAPTLFFRDRDEFCLSENRKLELHALRVATIAIRGHQKHSLLS
jgi:hypothetical protein